MKRNLILSIIIVIVVALGIWYFINKTDFIKQNIVVSTYEECVVAGYPVMESYPPQCKTPDGVTFTQNIGNTGGAGTTKPNTPPTSTTGTGNASGLLVVNKIVNNTTIESPITITGKARGSFYFEASFPVQLLDSKGKVIAEAPAQALGDWMTNEFVPFKVTLSYTGPTEATTGTLVFHNDNPSGLPENDRELRIPVQLTPSVMGSFNDDVELSIGEKITFPDTLTVTLRRIEDSRCKPNVQCIWAGELTPVLLVGKAQSEVRLGTVSKQIVTFGNYTFTLRDATTGTATINVKKNI